MVEGWVVGGMEELKKRALKSGCEVWGYARQNGLNQLRYLAEVA